MRNILPSVFDRPTQYTMNSLGVQTGTKATMAARVFFKDDVSKGIPAAKYLSPNAYGGQRQDKRSELGMKYAGKMPRGKQAAPASGAEIDRHGNMNRGQVVKMLSSLRANLIDSSQNASRTRRSRGKRRAERYFAILEQSHLAPGVYMTKGRGGLRPILSFIAPPTYSVRLPFDELVRERVADHFPAQFERALEEALATAR